MVQTALQLREDFRAPDIEGLRQSDNPLTPYDVTLKNPYDLYPAQRLFEQRVEEELAQCAPGQPLVILSGEEHATAEHVVSHITRLDYLKRKQQEHPNDPSRRFLFASEVGVNMLATFLRCLGGDIPKTRDMDVAQMDPDNQFALQFMVLYSTSLHAPVTNRGLSHFVWQNTIPTVFNDAATDKSQYCISPVDPLVENTAKALKGDFPKCSVDDLKRAHRTKPEGMAMRNLVMVQRALQTAQDTQSKIIFQLCGSAHLFGHKQKGFLFKHSLSEQFRQTGARVLPIYNLSSLMEWREPLETITEPQAWEAFPNTVILRNMGGMEMFVVLSRDEEALLHRLKHQYSGPHCPFDIKPDGKPRITAEQIVEALNSRFKQRGIPTLAMP